jgi:putative ABC transport system ATP-binding protein
LSQMLVVERVSKEFPAGDDVVHAVRDISLTIGAGEFVALVGPSGCGKSTLLHLCGAMDRPTTGSITLAGSRIDTLGEDALTRLRREQVGFVFQAFNLLPTLTLLENIAMPLLLAGRPGQQALEKAGQLAERVGVSHRANHYPQQLSGGEMQRVAIARAVIHRPALLVADEPTGNLDSDSGRRVLALLSEINREVGATLLLATHAANVAAAADRIAHLRDGRLERIEQGRGARAAV